MTLDTTISTLHPGPKFSQRREWASRQAIGFLMQQAVENPGVISLAAGLVDPAGLPVEETKAAFAKIFADDRLARHALQYGTTAGAERLRSLLLKRLATLEGCTVKELGIDVNQVVLTTGSQQLLSLIAEVLFDPGDICLVAAPTYFVFLGVLEGIGARAIPIATDENGMQTDALERQLEQLEASGELDRVKLIYLVSYYENPSGISLSEERRGQVVEIAERFSKGHRIFILEDAAYRDLHYDGPALPSVWGQDASRKSVILTQTFSKSFAPGLRVGFGVCPEALVTPLMDRKGNEDFGSSNFSQQLIAAVMELGLLDEHVANLRESYRAKRDAMLAAADRYFSDIPGVSWVHPHGGLYVWMSLPESIDTSLHGNLFWHAVRKENVMYVPGDLFYVGSPGQRPSHQMRLSFGVESPANIDLGMKQLAQAVRSVLG